MRGLVRSFRAIQDGRPRPPLPIWLQVSKSDSMTCCCTISNNLSNIYFIVHQPAQAATYVQSWPNCVTFQCCGCSSAAPRAAGGDGPARRWPADSASKSRRLSVCLSVCLCPLWRGWVGHPPRLSSVVARSLHEIALICQPGPVIANDVIKDGRSAFLKRWTWLRARRAGWRLLAYVQAWLAFHINRRVRCD